MMFPPPRLKVGIKDLSRVVRREIEKRGVPPLPLLGLGYSKKES